MGERMKELQFENGSKNGNGSMRMRVWDVGNGSMRMGVWDVTCRILCQSSVLR